MIMGGLQVLSLTPGAALTCFASLNVQDDLTGDSHTRYWRRFCAENRELWDGMQETRHEQPNDELCLFQAISVRSSWPFDAVYSYRRYSLEVVCLLNTIGTPFVLTGTWYPGNPRHPHKGAGGHDVPLASPPLGARTHTQHMAWQPYHS